MAGRLRFIGLSTYSTNILTLLVVAAGTDYAIFLVGRYHEERSAGVDRQTAFYDTYRGTSHVILGSGLTIIGAVYCLSFTRNPYFQSWASRAIGVFIALIAALTFGPRDADHRQPLRADGSQTQCEDPRLARIGTAIVRWPDRSSLSPLRSH